MRGQLPCPLANFGQLQEPQLWKVDHPPRPTGTAFGQHGQLGRRVHEAQARAHGVMLVGWGWGLGADAHHLTLSRLRFIWSRKLTMLTKDTLNALAVGVDGWSTWVVNFGFESWPLDHGGAT